MVELEEKPGDQGSYYDWSSEDHECLYHNLITTHLIVLRSIQKHVDQITHWQTNNAQQGWVKN